MRVIFFGSPNFALPSLKIINDSNHTIDHIVTSPDSKSGRGLKVKDTPVSKFAIDHNIPCSKPSDLGDPNFIKDLAGINADIFVVIAFKILPSKVFSIPQYGSINLHASLLPKYRGAAPIEHSILNGDKYTGVTTFCIDEKVDTGKILLSSKYYIGDDSNFGIVHNDLSQLGAKIILETINRISTNSIKPISQKEDYSRAPKIINSQDCKIDFNKPASFVYNQVRAFSPNRGAFTFINNRRVKIFKVAIDKIDLYPGEILIDTNIFAIGCNVDTIRILELQMEGKQKMSIREFLKGSPLKNISCIDG